MTKILAFGLVVLAEIASRALSPAVNDNGTAIDVLDVRFGRFHFGENLLANSRPKLASQDCLCPR